MGFVTRIFTKDGNIDYIRRIDEELHEEVNFLLVLENEYKQKIAIAGSLTKDFNKGKLGALRQHLNRVKKLVAKEERILRRFKRRIVDQEDKVKALLDSLPMATVDFSGLSDELDLPKKFEVLGTFLQLEDKNLQNQMGFFRGTDKTLISRIKLAELLALIKKEGEILLCGEDSPEYKMLIDLEVLIEDLEPKKGLISWNVFSNLHHKSNGFDHGVTSQGTWGRGGAGILVITPDAKEILLFKRSYSVMDPGLWGTTGGARREQATGMEHPLITAVTESIEEMGPLPFGNIRKKPFIFKKPHTTFTYHTYIFEINPKEKKKFVPRLNWENDDWKWFKINQAESVPLHPGVKVLLDEYRF